mgnify:CR=1 FL=1
MSLSFKLDATSRSDLGKGASRRLRRANSVPAVVYGGVGEAQSITLAHNEMEKSLEHEAFYSHILDLVIDGGKPQQVILRDVQRHPFKRLILHVDFLRVQADQEIQVQVPLHFLNEEECIGVKQDGGAISHVMTEILISCLPRHLPEYIEVDLANLGLGDALHVSDIQFPEGVVSVDLAHGEEHDLPVANVHHTRAGSVESDDADEDAGDAGESEGEAEGE